MRLAPGITALTMALGLSAATAQPLTLNLPATFAPVKSKLALGQTASIVVIGDSLAYRAGTWLPEYRAHMQNLYGDAGLGYMSFSVWSGAETSLDYVWGLIGSDTVPHRALDGMWVKSPASGGWCTYAAGAARSLTLMLPAEPGAGVVTAHPPGLPDVVLDTLSPTPHLTTMTLSNPAGLGTVSFNTAANPVTFLGVVLKSNNPGVFVHRVANGGWGVFNYLQRDWTFDAELAALAPDLVYIWLGQNDQGYSSTYYQTPLNQLVDRVLAVAPAAKIVLVGTYDSGSSNLPPLVQAMQTVAANRTLGFIDLYHAAGNYWFFASHGYLDGVHFTPAGGAYVGQVMFDAFQTDGADFCDVQFVIQPEPVTAFLGHEASFGVIPGSSGPITYRWRHDGVELSDGGRISGAATTVLTISDIVSADAGSYDLLATGPCGATPSAAALLTVSELCPSDIDLNGFVNADDFDLFMGYFYWGDVEADFDRNSFVNGDDFDAFMDAFSAGC